MHKTIVYHVKYPMKFTIYIYCQNSSFKICRTANKNTFKQKITTIFYTCAENIHLTYIWRFMEAADRMCKCVCVFCHWHGGKNWFSELFSRFLYSTLNSTVHRKYVWNCFGIAENRLIYRMSRVLREIWVHFNKQFE